jgi:hypothetical protein
LADSKTPSYVAIPLADLPKRVGRPRTFNEEAAKAMLEIVKSGENSVTDNLVTDQAAAQKAAALAKRLIAHVAPDTLKIRTKVYADGDGFRWAVFAEPVKAKK